MAGASDWLSGRLVVELGCRIAVGACGSLMAQAGATVVIVETHRSAGKTGKFATRSLFAAGKRSIAVDFNSSVDVDILENLLRSADAVLLSSDSDEPLPDQLRKACEGAPAVCDFVALDREGADAAQPLTDASVQALSGIAHTTGFPGGPPVVLRVPIVEYSAAVYGASACVAAFETVRRFGKPQTIEISLFDCAINALSTFLPAIYKGEEPSRLGNGHPIAAPWNAYEAKDGWILICLASDVHWTRFCRVIGRLDLLDETDFSKLTDRAARRAQIDEIVLKWTRGMEVDQCIDRLSSVGLASGAILRLSDLQAEPNIHHRGMIVQFENLAGVATIKAPSSILQSTDSGVEWPVNIPGVDEDRSFLTNAGFVRLRQTLGAPVVSSVLALSGVKVLEIGQYTTAPLTARHLATLGATVLKIEPPTGDAAREWAPKFDGLSMFFAMSNSGKTCHAIDLKSDQGRAAFAELIRTSDVLVENMKPGSLAAVGFDSQELERLNARLIYCTITGFGNNSAYPNRPAFDTVVQAMSGMMDANAWSGLPLKAGISACDFMGGEVGLFAVLAALHRRATTGRGTTIDLSMQDIGAWMTAVLWDKPTAELSCSVMLECTDGFVFSEEAEGDEAPAYEATRHLSKTRSELADELRRRGVQCQPVLTIGEALSSPIGMRRAPIHPHRTESGQEWPILKSPMQMFPTSPVLGAPAGKTVAVALPD